MHIRRSAFAVLSSLALGACVEGDTVGIPTDATRLPDQQQEQLVLEMHASTTDRERRVIRDAQEWQSFWASARGTATPAPTVDFSRSIVLVTSMGRQPTGGYTIRNDVYVSPYGLHVIVTETSPAASCTVTQAPTHPMLFLRVDRTPPDVRFVERRNTRRC